MSVINLFNTAVLVFVLSLSPFISRSQQIYFPPPNNTDWVVTSPESLGWCTDKIAPLYNFLESNNTKAFIVLKDGKIVLEKYFGTFTADSLWYWASAGKTMTGMLAGIAKVEGYLKLDTAVSAYLGKGWTSCPPEKEALIKVRNQLTMTTGLDDRVSDPDCTSPSCLQYLADAGTRWAYHNAPYSMLNPLITAATGIDFKTYFNSMIRNKIGMNGLWVNLNYNHIYFSTARSFAKFGLLLLAKGTWNGTPILSDTAYLRALTNTSQNLNKSYGQLTWLNGKQSYMLPQSQFVFPGPLCPDAPAEMYAAMGKNGQLINVVPSKGLIMIRMGNAPGSQFEVPNAYNNQIWQQLNMVICNPTGSSEATVSKEPYEIYPNPANTEINIVPGEASKYFSTFLLNLNGQLVQKYGNQRILDVSTVPPGNYLLIIISNGTKFMSKISIIR